jgi:hypothetical protein
MQEPRREPADLDAERVRDPSVVPERAEHALVLVAERAEPAPCSDAATLSASTLAWRSACCAVGGEVPWLACSSGTAAMSPAAQAPSTPSTRKARSTRIRPRSSTGKPDPAASGDARTPAVHTRVSAANDSPSDSCTTPSWIRSSRVPVRISIARSRRRSAAYDARSGSSSGRIRGAASTITQRWSDRSSVGIVSVALRARSSSSPSASIPANPAPTNTNVSAARFASSSASSAARSS